MRSRPLIRNLPGRKAGEDKRNGTLCEPHPVKGTVKNWLFANTPGGAQASAVIYSLIETAKENGLDPYRYLLWVLRNAPGLSKTDEAWAEKLLPARAPEECYMPQK